ncbi:MAG TPA: caspase family protein [Haliangium sp.]|nr:caspase family protein [Haliangium sp.]
MLHAIVIGIDRHADPRIRNLTCARNDAHTFGALLSERIAPAERRVTMLLDEQATRAAIMQAVGEDLVRAAQPDDVAIIYFAGHGSPERAAPRDEDWPYLIAHDTQYDRIYSTGIDMVHDVSRWLERLGVRLAVLFLDACFSGAAGGRTFGGPLHLAHRDRFRADPLSLADLDLGEGKVIISAARDNEVALELRSLGHGVFTHHLLQTLQRPPSADRTIGVSTLYDTVSAAVYDATQHRQCPVITGRSMRGALPLLGAAAAGEAAVATASTTTTP